MDHDDDELDPAERDRIERKLEAWDLKVEGKSLAYIAEKIGVSKTSAWRWVQDGRDLAAQLDYLDRTRGREEGAAVMELVRSWMLELRAELDPVDQVAAAKVVIAAEERRSKLIGLDAPTRIDGTFGARDSGGPVVEGRVVRGVDRALEQYHRGGDPRDDDGTDPPGAGEGRDW